MSRILIAYGTREGQTAAIAEYLANVIREHGHRVETLDIKGSRTIEPDSYDAVIVGASVHVGRHENYVREFVRRYHDALERLPSAFFSVSLAAHDDTEAGRKEAAGYLERFVQEVGWRPARAGLFAGALLYTRYGFFTRRLMKTITRAKGSPDTDTSRDYLYTDWAGVRRFAEEFLGALPLQTAPGAREAGA